MSKALAAAAFLALHFYIYNYLATDRVIPPRETFASFPDRIGDWECPERERMDDRVIRNLGVTDYLICNFVNPRTQAIANVYIGYHASQVREEGGGSNENSIHPPKHCLPGSGWDIIHQEQVEAPFLARGDGPAPRINRLVIARGEARQLVYYWYHSRGRVIADDWKKIVLMSWDRATKSRTDGSLVRFTMPIPPSGVEPAERSFADLAPRIAELLPRFVPE